MFIWIDFEEIIVLKNCLNFALKFAAYFTDIFVLFPKWLQDFLFKPHLTSTHRQILPDFDFVFEPLKPYFCSIALQSRRLRTQSLQKLNHYKQLFSVWFYYLYYGFFCRNESKEFGHNLHRSSYHCQSPRTHHKQSRSK